MKPLYALLRDRCGLSLQEAADYHGVPVNTVNKWSQGTRNPPPRVLAELRELYARIEAAADKPDKTLPVGARSAALGLAAMRQV